MKENRYLTVYALTKYIKRKFDADPHLQDVYFKGEISNFKQHSSGHMYFTVKDEKARILAVMFSSASRLMKFTPENGMKVLIRGDISVYESSGNYQVYVKEMHPDGIGELFLAYEQLKAKLESEGLFLDQYKKPIPKYPKKVGVITSPTGAAVRDIITTIKRRYPIAGILIFPALVQGDQAGASIVHAIENANKRNEVDVLIVGRGGGSIEELWSFNEEKVARAIFSSNIPIISAVGHETDFTIADFVADRRAATPTGAAELAVPHIDDLLEKTLTRKARLVRAMKERLVLQRERLNRVQRSYAFKYPRRLYEQKLEQVDRVSERLNRAASIQIDGKKDKLAYLAKMLERNHPNEKLQKSLEVHNRSTRALKRAMLGIYANKERDFSAVIATLEALSPLKIMDRGYSLVYTQQGRLVKSVLQLEKDEEVKVKLSDGNINCKITGFDGE